MGTRQRAKLGVGLYNLVGTRESAKLGVGT